MNQCVIDVPGLRVYHGNAIDWDGPEAIDLVFTNPYGPMPSSLRATPMIIHQWKHRKAEAERWCGNTLNTVVSPWNDDREVFWSANIADPFPLNLREYKPEPGGWYPEPLVRIVFDAYLRRGMTVWDGFMGRGTIAKIAREYGVSYVGVEQLSDHIAFAKEYLHLASV